MNQPDLDRSTLSTSLLLQLRRQEPDAWNKVSQIFGPLVYHWCRRAGCAPLDSADITQDVFRSVYVSLDSFRYDQPADSFRGWLATITRNKIRDQFRRHRRTIQPQGGSDFRTWLESQADDVAAAGDLTDDSSELYAAADRRAIVQRATEQLRGEFEERSWNMFWRTTVDGHAPSDVARDLGVSIHAVYKAKSRILQRLRVLLAGLT